MAVPKRKTSKSRIRSRRRTHDLKRPKGTVGTCGQCGEAVEPHRVCAKCGYYRGRQILTIEAD